MKWVAAIILEIIVTNVIDMTDSIVMMTSVVLMIGVANTIGMIIARAVEDVTCFRDSKDFSDLIISLMQS